MDSCCSELQDLEPPLPTPRSETPRPLAVRAFRALLLGIAALVLGAEARAETIVADGRPATLHVPTSYDPSSPAPLVILLHGYTSSGAAQEAYMQFSPLAEEFGFLYLTPDGTVNCLAVRFWNATDACCNFCGSLVDDVGYIQGLIEATALAYAVDPRRVFLIGHSNGGFMSHRFACEGAESIAAIASLAGATFSNPAQCTPSRPVHVLQIHGDDDATILYDGGSIVGVPYPGAVETTQQWAALNGCSPIPETFPLALDLDQAVPGLDTTIDRHAADCASGGSAELWTIAGGGHIPFLSPDFSRLVIEYLLAHPQPEPPPPVPVLPRWSAPLMAALLLAARSIRRR